MQTPTDIKQPNNPPRDCSGPAAQAAVRVANLRKSYRGTEAVRGLSFTVRPGEIFALLGPNGAGKTTTLEILEGFRARDSGQVEVLGLDPEDRATGRHLREQIGLVLQDIAVEPYLTVRETVARNAGYYPAPRGVAEVIALVGLAGHERSKVRSLSGGQKRRLDLALGIVGRPRLLFLDEPTTGFDPSARQTAWDIVRGLRADGTTILLTTHYMEEAQVLADRVAVIADGRMLAEGPPAELGGQAAGRAAISFALPAGNGPADLPGGTAAWAAGSARLVTAQVPDPVPVLHELTGWALRTGVPLARLSVQRPTLEDIYLRLTAAAADKPDEYEPASDGPAHDNRGRTGR